MSWRWISWSNFFEWWQDPDSVDNFRKSLDENIRSLMELMDQSWDSIMFMPYKFFVDTLKWKINLEDEKAKQMTETTGGKTSKGLTKG